MQPTENKFNAILPFFKSIFSINTLVSIVLVLQLVFLYFLINPINVFTQLNSVNMINKIGAAKDANLPVELPTSLGIVGDGVKLQDIEVIKKSNQVDAEIYKNAANGDYVVAYPTRLVIYRPSNNSIVYSGPTPQNKLQETQTAIIGLVVKKAKDAKLIPADYNTAPQVSIVTSAEEMKKVNADFYKDTLKDDLVSSFSNPNLVMIYRPSEDKIIKSGTIQVAIK
jgi:hypothetical protein